MSFNFPTSPILNQTHTIGNKTWQWNGSAWNLLIINETTIDTTNLLTAWNTGNTAYSVANGAYDQANTATLLAQDAYDYANTITVFSGDYNDLSNLPNLNVYATTDSVNDAIDLAQDAYDAANSAIGSIDNTARDVANAAYDQANSSFDQANSAVTLAQAAYDQANTGGGGGATESLNVQFDNDNATQYKVVSLNANAETILASALDITQVDKILGILDSTGETVTYGTITNDSWTWTPEQSVYLGSNGDIVTTSTVDGATFSLKLGTAISATRIFVKIGTPVIL